MPVGQNKRFGSDRALERILGIHSPLGRFRVGKKALLPFVATLFMVNMVLTAATDPCVCSINLLSGPVGYSHVQIKQFIVGAYGGTASNSLERAPRNISSPANISSYIIYVEGEGYYAKNGRTGAIDYNGFVASTVINNVINELANGGEILLKAGVYWLDTCITSRNRDGIILRGEGRTTIIKMKDQANDDVIRLGAGGQGVDSWVICDLAIDGNKANCPTNRDGIAIGWRDAVSCNNILLMNLYIHDCDEFGVCVSHSTEGSPVCKNVQVVNCEFVNNGWNGVTLKSNAQDCLITGNKVTGSSDVGITCYGKKNTIENNTVLDCTSNDGDSNSHIGIALEGGNNIACEQNLVLGNVVYNCHEGISANTRTSLIRDNSVKGNTVHDCDYGITIWQSTMRILVEGNDAWNCHNSEIIVNGSNCTITGNSCTTALSKVVADYWGAISCQGSNNVIKGNKCLYNGPNIRSGILVNGGDHNIVDGNDIKRMSWSGIYLCAGADKNMVEDNLVVESAEYGIYIEGADCVENCIKNNNLEDNRAGAIWNAGTGTVFDNPSSTTVTLTTTTLTATSSTTTSSAFTSVSAYTWSTVIITATTTSTYCQTTAYTISSGTISTAYTTRETFYSTMTSLSTRTSTSTGTYTSVITQLSKTGTATVARTSTSIATSGNTVYANIIVQNTFIEQFLERIVSTVTEWISELTQIFQNVFLTETVRDTVVRVEPITNSFSSTTVTPTSSTSATTSSNTTTLTTTFATTSYPTTSTSVLTSQFSTTSTTATGTSTTYQTTTSGATTSPTTTPVTTQATGTSGTTIFTTTTPTTSQTTTSSETRTLTTSVQPTSTTTSSTSMSYTFTSGSTSQHPTTTTTSTLSSASTTTSSSSTSTIFSSMTTTSSFTIPTTTSTTSSSTTTTSSFTTTFTKLTTTSTTTSSTRTSYASTSVFTSQRLNTTTAAVLESTLYQTSTTTRFSGSVSTTYTSRTTFYAASTSLSTATLTSAETRTSVATELSKTGTATVARTSTSIVTSGNTVYANIIVQNTFIEQFVQRIISTFTYWTSELAQIVKNVFVTGTVRDTVVKVEPTASATTLGFSLSSSGGITVTQGGSGSNTITIALVSGSTQSVSLSASGLPSGAIASFNPSSGNPTFSSTCTISTSPSTPTGVYTITVTGTGGGLTRTATFTLGVNSRGEVGKTRIVLDASPKSGYVNKPVTISGVVYGSWRRIKGAVVGAPVEITTSWGFGTSVVTDDQGQFSVTTTCPSTGGTYQITAKFYEDEDLTGASETITYQVIAKIETSITISFVGNREFGGYLRRLDTGTRLQKPVKLTVHYLSGGTWQTTTYDLQTRQDGYWNLEFLFYWNSATVTFEGDETFAASTAIITR